jgi:hypothetical protein
MDDKPSYEELELKVKSLEKEITRFKSSDFILKEIVQVGLALSAERNINKILEIIINEARIISNADAGTLYIVTNDKKFLQFMILQNDTMNTRMIGDEITLPKVPLYSDNKPNYSNVSSYVALTGEPINIPDVYKADGFDFTGPKKYDDATGYKSKSMIVIPMRNHEKEIIGVLQLLNAKDLTTKEVIFPKG